MTINELPEIDISTIDWASLSESDKNTIINKHINYINVSRCAFSASGSYVSNIRSLLCMMVITFIMSFLLTNNKTIIITLIGLQFIKTIFSKLFENYLLGTVNVVKEDFMFFINNRIRKNI